MKFLQKLVWGAAYLGGAIALLVALGTTFSVTRRALTGKPYAGDIELVQIGVALAISLCLAWCQWRGANIIVDFFTQTMRTRLRLALDAIGCILIACMYALLSWRTLIGAQSVASARETSMTLELPMWWAYACLAPGLALAAIVALTQSWYLLRGKAFVGTSDLAAT